VKNVGKWASGLKKKAVHVFKGLFVESVMRRQPMSRREASK